jgi:predicted glycosyltransferase involved in capsule biosynthesis
MLSIIIPYKLNDESRKKIFEWNVVRYKEFIIPKLRKIIEVELILKEDKNQIFYKTKTLNQAVREASGKLILFSDMDVFFEPKILIQSISLMKIYPWVYPWNMYYALTSMTTRNILKKTPNIKFKIINENSYKYKNTTAPAGLLLFNKSDYYKVNGMDESFQGWGSEDRAFFYAMSTIVGPPFRNKGNLYHLWHPRERNNSIKKGTFDKNQELVSKYKAALDNKNKMIEVINRLR